MAITSDTVLLGEIPETVVGTTPTTPAFNGIRATGEGVNFTPAMAESAELVPGRGLADNLLVGGAAAGPLNFELSKNVAFEHFLAGLMCSDWGDTLGFTSGQMPAGWDSSWLACGQEIKTFSYVKEFPVDTFNYLHVFPASFINSLQLNITPGQIITGSWGLVGGPVHPLDAPIAGQTWVPPAIRALFAAQNVVTAEFRTENNGSVLPIGIGNHCFSNIVLNLTNNQRARECIGFLGTKERALGRIGLTITATIYFSSNDLLNMLIDQTAFTFAMTLSTAPAGAASYDQYTFQADRMKVTACNIVAGGTGQDVVAEVTMSGLQPTVIPHSPLLIQRKSI
jgi:hypothetical protein